MPPTGSVLRGTRTTNDAGRRVDGQAAGDVGAPAAAGVDEPRPAAADDERPVQPGEAMPAPAGQVRTPSCVEASVSRPHTATGTFGSTSVFQSTRQ